MEQDDFLGTVPTGSSMKRQQKCKLLYFEWSPPWHLFVVVSNIASGRIYGLWYNLLTFDSGILSGIYSDILSGILCGISTDIFSGIVSDIFSAICFGIRSGISSDILFWHSICYIFEDSLWSRSGWEHSDPVLAVRVRWGTLRSSACSWGRHGVRLVSAKWDLFLDMQRRLVNPKFHCELTKPARAIFKSGVS